MSESFDEVEDARRAWGTGAARESRVAAQLDRIASETIRVLHDRRIPGAQTNIDHLVVTPRAVWVIDAKRYTGRPELRIDGGLLRPRIERLVLSGRDKSAMLDGVQRRAELVREVVGELPIIGSLCLVDSQWPLLGGAFTARGVQVLWPARLARRIQDLGRGHRRPQVPDVGATAALLRARFGSA